MRGAEQQDPRDGAHERRNEDRDLRDLLERTAAQRVGAHENPSEQRAEHGRDQRGAAAHDDRVEECDPVDLFGQDFRHMFAGNPAAAVGERLEQDRAERQRD